MDSGNISNIYNYILYSESELNVLPLSSKCHNLCVFCSHKNIISNDYLKPFLNYYRSSDEVIDHIQFLNPNKKIVIGESATKIFEGDPFLYNDILKILLNIRKKCKNNVISITTLGCYISNEFYNLIHNFVPLEINFSLNSYNQNSYEKIIKGNLFNKAIYNFQKLYELSLKFPIKINVSLMAISNKLTPIDEIINDIINLNQFKNIQLIKIYLPRFNDKQFNLFFENFLEFEEYSNLIIEKITNNIKIDIPVIIEPIQPFFEINCATIHSIIYNSFLYKNGIKSNDKIIAINDKTPINRLHAYKLIVNSKKKLKLDILTSDNQIKTITLNDYTYQKYEALGMILTYDLDDLKLNKLIQINKELNKKDEVAILVTTHLSLDYMNKVIDYFKLSNILAIAFKNYTFGGNIDCTNLLTFYDINLNLKNLKKHMLFKNITSLIINQDMLDHLNIDLNGLHLNEFQNQCNLKIYYI